MFHGHTKFRFLVNIPTSDCLFKISLSYTVPIASVIAKADVVLWLMVVCSLSGLVILSGVYEIVLAHKVLRSLCVKDVSSKIQSCRLTSILLIVASIKETLGKNGLLAIRSGRVRTGILQQLVRTQLVEKSGVSCKHGRPLGQERGLESFFLLQHSSTSSCICRVF